MSKRPTLAAFVAMPERNWRTAVESMLGQVDQVAVYLNKFTEVPREIKDWNCWWYIDQWNNRGAEGNFWWTKTWDGVYIPCGDDLIYPANYVTTLTDCLERYDNRIVAAVHGKRYRGLGVNVLKPEWWGRILGEVKEDQWINYPGTGGAAFDTHHVPVPSTFPMRNTADAQFSAWLQEHRVPVRMLAHKYRWVGYCLPKGCPTIWDDDKSKKFARRRSIAEPIDWQVWLPDGTTLPVGDDVTLPLLEVH